MRATRLIVRDSRYGLPVRDRLPVAVEALDAGVRGLVLDERPEEGRRAGDVAGSRHRGIVLLLDALDAGRDHPAVEAFARSFAPM